MIRAALAFIAAFALASPAGAQTAADSAGKQPIHFDKKSSAFKKSPGVAAALSAEPFMERGLTVDSPPKIIEYFMSRPELASRLIEELGFGSGVTEGEEGDGWAFAGRSGARYIFHPQKAGKDIRVVLFFYSHSTPLAPGIKITGSGAVVVSASPGKAGETAALDYDVYFAEGGQPLDKIAGSVSIHMAEITADLAALADGFVNLCEAAHEDPESVADEMRDADDVFTKKEIDGFESAMKVKRRVKGR